MATVSASDKKAPADSCVDSIAAPLPDALVAAEKAEISETREIFHDSDDGVKFRTVSWQRATVIILKIQFAMGILSVPGALATLGAVGGALSIVGWMALNTCTYNPPHV